MYEKDKKEPVEMGCIMTNIDRDGLLLDLPLHSATKDKNSWRFMIIHVLKKKKKKKVFIAL